MTTGLKAIETRYKGYRFRSRLEARWAIYFERVGLAFNYEPEGFHLGPAGPYLPDFWLPGVESWAEVKAQAFTPDEVARCAALVAQSGFDCVLLAGTPEARPYERIFRMHSAETGHLHRHVELPSGLGLCDAKIDAEYVSEKRWFVCTGWDEIDDDTVTRAVMAARSARFEHGESGPPR